MSISMVYGDKNEVTIKKRDKSLKIIETGTFIEIMEENQKELTIAIYSKDGNKLERNVDRIIIEW